MKASRSYNWFNACKFLRAASTRTLTWRGRNIPPKLMMLYKRRVRRRGDQTPWREQPLKVHAQLMLKVRWVESLHVRRRAPVHTIRELV